MAQIKKISVATVYGAIDAKAVLNSTAPIRVMDVYGYVVNTKTVETPYGNSTALMGQFEAVNPDGEVTQASIAYLPEIALIPLQTALAQNGTNGVRFGIRLFVQEAKNRKQNGSVYEYTFEPLLPPSADDPMAKLREEMQSAALKLAGPKAGESDTPAPAPAPAPANAKAKK